MKNEKELKFTFDNVFKKLVTERSSSNEEKDKVLTYTSSKHIKKNLAKVLFKQKFGVMAEKVNSVTVRKIIKIRTQKRRDEKTKIIKKFFFQLPEGFKTTE